jgi:hypothetical protein
VPTRPAPRELASCACSKRGRRAGRPELPRQVRRPDESRLKSSRLERGRTLGRPMRTSHGCEDSPVAESFPSDACSPPHEEAWICSYLAKWLPRRPHYRKRKRRVNAAETLRRTACCVQPRGGNATGRVAAVGVRAYRGGAAAGGCSPLQRAILRNLLSLRDPGSRGRQPGAPLAPLSGGPGWRLRLPGAA